MIPEDQNGCFQAEVGVALEPKLNAQLTGEGCTIIGCEGCGEPDEFCAMAGAKAEARVILSIADITFNQPSCTSGLSGGVTTFDGATFDVPVTGEISGKVAGVSFSESLTFNFLTCNTNDNPICSVVLP